MVLGRPAAVTLATVQPMQDARVLTRVRVTAGDTFADGHRDGTVPHHSKTAGS